MTELAGITARRSRQHAPSPQMSLANLPLLGANDNARSDFIPCRTRLGVILCIGVPVGFWTSLAAIYALLTY